MNAFNSPFIDSIIRGTIEYAENLKRGNQRMKDQALKEYWDACNLPRKKKKKARKSANLLYSIACWGDDILI